MDAFAICDRCERDINYGEESSVVIVNRETSSLEDGETVVRIQDSQIAATLCRECDPELDVARLKAAATNQ